MITVQTLQKSNHIWNEAIQQWNANDYLRAMEGMQFALEVYQTAWSYFGSQSQSLELSKAESGEHMKDDVVDGSVEEDGEDFVQSSMLLAKRLLF